MFTDIFNTYIFRMSVYPSLCLFTHMMAVASVCFPMTVPPRQLKKRKNNIERAITQLFKREKIRKHNSHTATGNLNPKLWIRIYSHGHKKRNFFI